MADETFLDLGENLDDVPELHTLTEGEHLLRLVSAKAAEGKNNPDVKFIQATLESVADPQTKLITTSIFLPKPTDPERRQIQSKQRIRDFYNCFGIPTSGPVDFTQYEGAEGWAMLKEEDDAEYGMQNRVARFIPRK